MTLVDTNVFMYAGGRPHPNKSSSKAFLRQVVNGSVSAAIDAEVLQEILHRYRAVNRWEDGKKAYDLTRSIMRNVVSITADVMDDARLLMDLHPHLTARDALHLSAYVTIGADSICRFDQDFDRVPGIVRRQPSCFLDLK